VVANHPGGDRITPASARQLEEQTVLKVLRADARWIEGPEQFLCGLHVLRASPDIRAMSAGVRGEETAVVDAAHRKRMAVSTCDGQSGKLRLPHQMFL